METRDQIQQLPGGLINPIQSASAVMRAIFLALEYTDHDKANAVVPLAFLHFHDGSSVPIAWNDAHAIQLRNQYLNESMPVPLTATEGYNEHGHTSPYDGGFIPGRGIHDHRDNLNGGFCFSVYAPGTALPQQPWAI